MGDIPIIYESAQITTMAGLLILNSASLTLSLPTQTTTRASFVKPPTSPAIRFEDLVRRKTMRGLKVVTRAGPNSSSYIYAFVFPFTLLAVTIFTSIKIADKLDRDYLEDLAVSEAIRQEEEEDGTADNTLEKDPEPESALPRTRNRPKRQA